MMQFSFDLISDLHLETWAQPLNWTNCATSPYCLILGNITADRATLISFLTHLGQCYQSVFYIDGDLEHQEHIDNLEHSYVNLSTCIESIPHVIYLQDNVVIINGVAILATNGWWGFDFDQSISPTQSALWYQEENYLSSTVIKDIRRASVVDANYMIASVARLQLHQDVKKIVLATHTVPNANLIQHDIRLAGTMQFNTMGNSFVTLALEQDTEKKVHTWCFGHYHGSVDRAINGIRYVNNCRGISNTMYSQFVYHPQRIVIDY